MDDVGAVKGAGKFPKDKIFCLKKYIADQAFKNAMWKGRFDLADAAIKFSALERNTPAGVASRECFPGDWNFMNPLIANMPSIQVRAEFVT